MKNILSATVLMISTGTVCAADMQAVPYTPYTRVPYVAARFTQKPKLRNSIRSA
jgi:hypothetical protein